MEERGMNYEQQFKEAERTGKLSIPELTTIDKSFRERFKQLVKVVEITEVYLPNLNAIRFQQSKPKPIVSIRLYKKVKHTSLFSRTSYYIT